MPHAARPLPAPADSADQYVKPFVCAVCGKPIAHRRAGTWKHVD